MAGFNIRDFTTNIDKKGGLMRNNKFLVRIPYPLGFDTSSVLKNNSRMIELFCDSTSLPGVTINTTEVRRHGYGPVEKFGFAPLFNNLQMTFISDKQGAMHNFFYNWTKIITNYDVRYGDFNSFNLQIPSTEDQRAYEISYKSTYISDVEIVVFDENGAETMKVVLRNAYPTAVGDIQMNWNDTNDFVRIPVSFTFTDFHIEYPTR